MVRCSQKAFDKCPENKYCGEPGTIVSEESECADFIYWNDSRVGKMPEHLKKKTDPNKRAYLAFLKSL